MSGRKVRFSEPIHQIRYIDLDKFSENTAARDGTIWQLAYLDRVRFLQRIKSVEELLGSIFNAEHRARIYKERFENFDASQLLSVTTTASIEPKKTAATTITQAATTTITTTTATTFAEATDIEATISAATTIISSTTSGVISTQIPSSPLPTPIAANSSANTINCIDTLK